MNFMTKTSKDIFVMNNEEIEIIIQALVYERERIANELGEWLKDHWSLHTSSIIKTKIDKLHETCENILILIEKLRHIKDNPC